MIFLEFFVSLRILDDRPWIDDPSQSWNDRIHEKHKLLTVYHATTDTIEILEQHNFNDNRDKSSVNEQRNRQLKCK